MTRGYLTVLVLSCLLLSAAVSVAASLPTPKIYLRTTPAPRRTAIVGTSIPSNYPILKPGDDINQLKLNYVTGSLDYKRNIITTWSARVISGLSVQIAQITIDFCTTPTHNTKCVHVPGLDISKAKIEDRIEYGGIKIISANTDRLVISGSTADLHQTSRNDDTNISLLGLNLPRNCSSMPYYYRLTAQNSAEADLDFGAMPVSTCVHGF
jgi:hypothetical protein